MPSGILAAVDDGYSWVARRVGWTQRSWLAGLFLIALALFLAWPDFGAFFGPEEWSEQAMDWKIDHPLQPIPAENFGTPAYNTEGIRAHLRKRTYRVTLPIAAHLLGLKMRGAELLGFVAAGGFLWVLFLQIQNIFGEDRAGAFLVGLALAGSFLGQWGLNKLTFFDGLGYLLLAAACLTRTPWWIALWIVLGGFSDERVILALPLLYVLQDKTSLIALSWSSLRQMNRARIGTVAGLAIFVVLRILFALKVGHYYDTSDVGIWMLLPNLIFTPANVLCVFKGLCVEMGAVLLALAVTRAGALWIILAAAAPSVAATLVVGDMGRSLAYAFPLLLILLKMMPALFDRTTVARLLSAGALLSLVPPTYYLWEGKLLPFPSLPFALLHGAVHYVRHH